jgi:hypothetical protein
LACATQQSTTDSGAAKLPTPTFLWEDFYTSVSPIFCEWMDTPMCESPNRHIMRLSDSHSNCELIDDYQNRCQVASANLQFSFGYK